MNSVSLWICICFHSSSRKSEVNNLNMNYTDQRSRMNESDLDIDSTCPLLMKPALLLFIP